MQAPALYATRFCQQAQWRLDATTNQPGVEAWLIVGIPFLYFVSCLIGVLKNVYLFVELL
jgi:hypothetical protein